MITTLTEVNPQQLDQIMAIWLASNLEAHDFVSESYWHPQFSSQVQR
jgi:hypothetical protein